MLISELKKYADIEKVFEKYAFPMERGEAYEYYFMKNAQIYDTYFIYEVLNKNERHNEFKTQIREIWYLTLDDLLDALYCIMKFKISS